LKILISFQIKPKLYKSILQILIMGTALVTIKMMPESPQASLEEIQEKAKKIVEENKGENPSTKTEPVAFGLSAVILNFSMDESLSQDSFEAPLKEIDQVASVEIIDFRRAFG
jgi:translation elongation factor aEF-1 beta